MAIWYPFDDENPDEFHCECCNNTGFTWEFGTDEQGREFEILVPCGCIHCYQPCPHIEDAFERSGE